MQDVCDLVDEFIESRMKLGETRGHAYEIYELDSFPMVVNGIVDRASYFQEKNQKPTSE